jgi:CheY-like chemotaxis protein
MVRNVASAILKRSGYDVVLARNGREALRLFEEKGSDVDAVLLDMSMPDLGGEEVFAGLRKCRDDVPVVLTSGHDLHDIVDTLSSHERTAFLRKPYRSSDLLRVLSSAIG